jgi:hypothetical protein
MSPATTKPTVKPGATLSGKFQVLNQGTGDYPVRVYAAPYAVHGENYTPDFTPVAGAINAADWLKFDVSRADIAANKLLDVHYTLTVPASTAPGGYYAVAFAETQSSETGHQGVVVNERVGEIFYIQVAGDVQQHGKLLTWSTNFWQHQPLQATVRLENRGTLDYASDIHVTVSDIFGHAKYVLNTNKEVLPQTVRRIPISWDKTPPLGLFKISGTATVTGQKQTLSTHYILVVSPFLRIVGLAAVGLFVAYAAGQRLGLQRKRRNAKQRN